MLGLSHLLAGLFYGPLVLGSLWLGAGLAADRRPGQARMVPLAKRLVSGTKREAA